MIKPWLVTAMFVGAITLAAPAVRAQRVEFPTPVQNTVPSPAASYGAAPPPTFDPYALPTNTPAAGAPYLPPGDVGYAAPYGGTPPALYPDGVPTYTGQGFAPIGNTWTRTMRFLQEIHADETWLPRGGGQHAMGVNTINTWVTFALPFYWNPNPILITPGFQLYLWDGPNATGDPPPTLPGETYGAYLDVAWSPQINNWLGAELEVSPGVYTDFAHTTSESLRILGRGLAVITLTDTLKLKFGVWYIDRLKIKLLPAVGLLWTPDPDSRYEIFFPAPKLAHRCNTIGNHNIWAYIRGEYGGGSWTVERPPGGTQVGTLSDQFDYNDIRLAIGADILPETQSGLRGYIEVGYVFDRELVFRGGMPSQFDLSDTMLLGGGFSFQQVGGKQYAEGGKITMQYPLGAKAMP